MPDAVNIEIKGLDRLMEAFEKFPKQVARNMSTAAREAAYDVILLEEGLQKYPPATRANQPPVPYYIRNRGMQTSEGRNTGKSENLGKQWYVKREGWTARVGNRASYAQYVHGEEQAHHMGPSAKIPKGWKKLFETAKKKVKQIEKVYQGWVNKTLKDLGI